MVRSQQSQYISFGCGSWKPDQIKRRVRAEPDVTVKMALGKRERRSVAHQRRKCAVLANGLGHFPDPQIVVIIKGLGKLNDRPTGESAEQLQPKRFMFGPSCSEIDRKSTRLNSSH